MLSAPTAKLIASAEMVPTTVATSIGAKRGAYCLVRAPATIVRIPTASAQGCTSFRWAIVLCAISKNAVAWPE